MATFDYEEWLAQSPESITQPLDEIIVALVLSSNQQRQHRRQ